jgi:hypothetical protein
MKCYRTTKEFVRTVCREKGQSRPKQTFYLVQDWQDVTRVEQKAPNSYHGLKQVIFSVDGRFATRRFGLWVESAESLKDWDVTWLWERQLREAVDRLWKKNLNCPFLRSSRNVDPGVEDALNEILDMARWSLYKEFNEKVIKAAKRMMEEDDYFSTLKDRGDLLNQAVA